MNARQRLNGRHGLSILAGPPAAGRRRAFARLAGRSTSAGDTTGSALRRWKRRPLPPTLDQYAATEAVARTVPREVRRARRRDENERRDHRRPVTQIAYHEARDDAGSWHPAMKVVLRRSSPSTWCNSASTSRLLQLNGRDGEKRFGPRCPEPTRNSAPGLVDDPADCTGLVRPWATVLVGVPGQEPPRQRFVGAWADPRGGRRGRDRWAGGTSRSADPASLGRGPGASRGHSGG